MEDSGGFGKDGEGEWHFAGMGECTRYARKCDAVEGIVMRTLE